MDGDRWRQVERIYQEALDLPEPERVEFVEGSCGPDHELRRQALAMLASDAQAGDFLESPALEDAARAMAHFAIRRLMREAALKANVDPNRPFYLHALRVVRRKLPVFSAIPLSRRSRFINAGSTPLGFFPNALLAAA